MLDGMLAQRYAIAMRLVETARQQHHIRTEVTAEAPPFTRVDRFGDDVLAEVDDPRYGAAVHSYFELVLAAIDEFE